MHSFTKLLYSAFIGLAFVGLVASAVFTFYPEASYVDCYEPRTVHTDQPLSEAETKEDYAKSQICAEEQAKMRDVRERNIAIIGLVSTLLIVLVQIKTRNSKNITDVVRDGFGAGALFTGVYTFSYAASSENRVLFFLTALGGVAIAIYVAQERFGTKATDKTTGK